VAADRTAALTPRGETARKSATKNAAPLEAHLRAFLSRVPIFGVFGKQKETALRAELRTVVAVRGTAPDFSRGFRLCFFASSWIEHSDL
jgi:hypothetical protein